MALAEAEAEAATRSKTTQNVTLLSALGSNIKLLVILCNLFVY